MNFMQILWIWQQDIQTLLFAYAELISAHITLLHKVFMCAYFNNLQGNISRSIILLK